MQRGFPSVSEVSTKQWNYKSVSPVVTLNFNQVSNSSMSRTKTKKELQIQTLKLQLVDVLALMLRDSLFHFLFQIFS